jgi:Ca-activated chloride channel homolog
VSSRAAGSSAGRRGRSRRVRAATLVAIAIAIAAVCMIGLSAKAVLARASCSNTPVLVNVAVSYDIAPAIQKIATTFNNQNVVADGRCAEVQVNEGSSAAEVSEIDGQAPMRGQASIDAWIPDSSLWVDVARSFPVGAQNVQPTGKSVAKSPLMLVTTPTVAAKTGIFGAPPSWNLLLPASFGGPPENLGLDIDLPDPTTSATGLATLIQVSRVLGTGASARAAFTSFALHAQSSEDFDSPSALQQFVQTTEPPFDRSAITVASEQAVIAYDRANPKAPLDARYPSGTARPLGTPSLDYPYVLTSSSAATLAAASDFGSYLQSSYARAVIRYYGFRSSDGAADTMPANSGLASQPLQLASAQSAMEAAANLEVWSKLGLGDRSLVLTDISPAMNQPDGQGTQTLEQLLNSTSAGGLALFPDGTNMGLWEMGGSTQLKQLVSIGPLDADFGVITRRAQLQQIEATTVASSSGTLALNDDILAAYKHMTAKYAPNYANAVLVLTAGVDNAHGDESLQTLLTQLRELYNPNKKVEVIILMFGTEGNFTAMKEIADATGGAAFQVTNPNEIGKIFIEAVSRRMCASSCAAP